MLEAGLSVRATPFSGDAAAVEDAAAAALVALAERLTEAPFASLLARLLAWALDAGAARSGGGAGRLASLLAAANAASERLRSVFGPFGRQLTDAALAALAGEAVPVAAAVVAKKQRTGAAAAPLSLDTSAWLARLRALRLLHRCLLYDAGGGFADAGAAARLLDPVAAALRVATPAAVAAALDADTAGGGPPPGVPPATPPSRTGVTPLPALARAAAGALAALAVATSGDADAAGAALLKPANHAALLATRDDAPTARSAALAAVGALATAAGTDYLPLLPDALPFLGELLEDGDDGVARRARALVADLEAAAGESLDPYLKA